MRDVAPQSDELEISIFGPGYGECVVVHCGEGYWLSIDSCFAQDRSTPIAKWYLDFLGVDVASNLKLLVVSHWHDDHIAGIDRLVEEATQARVVFPGALKHDEFLKLVSAAGGYPLLSAGTGTDTISNTAHALVGRKGPKSYGPDMYAQANTILDELCGVGKNVLIRALSPSAQSVSDGYAELAEAEIPKVGARIRRFRSFTPNGLSLVIRIEAEHCSLLLGGDLEVGGSDTRGWRAILCSSVSETHRCDVMKVSHHGSSNADHPDVWKTMLANDPYALLTPFAYGRKPLPSQSDLKRICAATSRAYITAWPPLKRPEGKARAIRRTVDEMATRYRTVRSKPGQIRLRRSLSQEKATWNVELFDGAQPLAAAK